MAVTEALSPHQDVTYAWHLLPKVSRSFAFVTRYLNEEKSSEIGNSVMVFYHICRVLDTIEDSSLPISEKKALYAKFLDNIENERSEEKLLNDSTILSNNPGYVELMDNSGRIISAYKTLAQKTRDVIKKYATQMAEGMHKFGSQEILSFQDLDNYCHPVAGIIGYALTELFYTNGHLPSVDSKRLELARHFGLALQKVNITRDYGQDFAQQNFFWPKSLVEKHGLTYQTLAENPDSPNALKALEEMIQNSQPNLEGALAYFLQIPESQEKVRMFCAVSLLLAAGTLIKVKDNPEVFRPNPNPEPLGKLKVRREEFMTLVRTIKNNITDNSFFENHFSAILPRLFKNGQKISAASV